MAEAAAEGEQRQRRDGRDQRDRDGQQQPGQEMGDVEHDVRAREIVSVGAREIAGLMRSQSCAGALSIVRGCDCARVVSQRWNSECIARMKRIMRAAANRARGGKLKETQLA